MPFIARNGEELFAVVIVRPVGSTLVREISFPYNPETPTELETRNVAALTPSQRSRVVNDLITDVASGYTALWLGRGWKAEIPSGTSVWSTNG